MSYDASRAWVIADSLNELYEFYRARIRPGDQSGQAEFARWCIAQKLWKEAEMEIEALRNSGMPAPQLRGLSLAIERARSGPAVARSTVAPATPPDSRAAPTLPRRSSTNLPFEVSPALESDRTTTSPPPATLTPTTSLPDATVSTRSTGLPPPRFQPTTNTPQTPAPIVNSVFSFFDKPGFENDSRVQEAIDDSVQQIAVNQFNESVHWSLVQACAGCHYPENEQLARATSFALEIPSAKHKATLEQTRYNLDQLLALINRENPGNSRLLGLLTQPHGTLKEPPLPTDSDDSRAITQWIYRSGIGESGRESESRVVPAHLETMETDQMARTPIADNIQLPRLIPGALGPQIDPARPYDPEPFNRMYHPAGPAMPVANGAIPTQPSSLPILEQSPVASSPLAPQTGAAPSSNRLLPPPGLPRVRRESPPQNTTGSTKLRPR